MTPPESGTGHGTPARTVILNGGSSSGKSGIVRCLQAILPDPWFAFGVDGLIDALPARMETTETGIRFGPEGEVDVGEQFRALEQQWTAGLVAMLDAGARIIIDDVFLSGAESQHRWIQALGELPVLWVGVHCASETAAARELARGDRVAGMALQQAETVHRGVRYDVQVDTTHAESLDCARHIARHL